MKAYQLLGEPQSSKYRCPNECAGNGGCKWNPVAAGIRDLAVHPAQLAPENIASRTAKGSAPDNPVQRKATASILTFAPTIMAST
jgi:hypothetical protein